MLAARVPARLAALDFSQELFHSVKKATSRESAGRYDVYGAVPSPCVRVRSKSYGGVVGLAAGAVDTGGGLGWGEMQREI